MVQVRSESGDPHKDGVAFPKQGWGPLQLPLYFEQCADVKSLVASTEEPMPNSIPSGELLASLGAQSE